MILEDRSVPSRLEFELCWSRSVVTFFFKANFTLQLRCDPFWVSNDCLNTEFQCLLVLCDIWELFSLSLPGSFLFVVVEFQRIHTRIIIQPKARPPCWFLEFFLCVAPLFAFRFQLPLSFQTLVSVSLTQGDFCALLGMALAAPCFRKCIWAESQADHRTHLTGFSTFRDQAVWYCLLSNVWNHFVQFPIFWIRKKINAIAC